MNDRVAIMRQAIVKITNMLAGKSITVSQQGVSAYVKADETGRPVHVNLPYMPDNATEELIQAIQGFLDHEVAHILFTDFTLMQKAGGTGSPAGNMLNILEDTRIEREMANRFQGCAYNLANTGKFFLDKYTTPKLNEAIAKGDDKMMVGVLMVPLLRSMAGQQVFKEFMKNHMGAMASVHDKIKDLAGRIEGLSSTEEALDVAKIIVKRLKQDDDEEATGKGKDKSKSSSSAAGKGEKAPGKGKSKAAPPPEPEDEDAEDEASAAGEEEGDDEDDDAEDDAAGGEGEGEEEGTADVLTAEDEADEDQPLVPPKAKKSEKPPKIEEGEEIDTSKLSAASWEAIDKETANGFDDTVSRAISNAAADVAAGSDYLVFTTDKDVVETLQIGKGYVDTMLTSLQSKVEHMVSPMQKDLERAISARSLSVYSAGHRSGRLHPSNLSRLAIKTPAGFDDRVFRRRHDANSKDVAVELVIDASGSMNGSKIHTAAQAAYALASTLERIGIKSDVICFTTGEACAPWDVLHDETEKIGRAYSRVESLYMPVLKSFDERMSTEVKKRFGWLPNANFMASNVDGECVEIAARRLLSRRETGKVMIVLSDGAPAASGGARGLEAHLKKVVQNTIKRGVNVIGIGIESSAVQKFYPKNMVLNNVEELPGAVMKELRTLIVQN